MTHKRDKYDKYADFADHPRYGRWPNVTGLNPGPRDRDVHLHWNTTTAEEVVAAFESALGKKWPFGDVSYYSNRTRRVANTAIPADLSK